MSWKKISYINKNSEQLNLFSDPEEQGVEIEETPAAPARKKLRRSDLYILRPYRAKSNGKCNSALDSCHKNGVVLEGDEMIRAIPMKGVPGPHFFFHNGDCADKNIRKIDEDANRAMMRPPLVRPSEDN